MLTHHVCLSLDNNQNTIRIQIRFISSLQVAHFHEITAMSVHGAVKLQRSLMPLQITSSYMVVTDKAATEDTAMTRDVKIVYLKKNYR